MPPSATVRPLQQGEWATWRSLRLRAIAESPDAFESTYADESTRPDDWWIDLIESCIAHERCELWFAETDGGPVGMAFATVDEAGDRVRIGAMWVAPEARGTGIGRFLLDAAIAWGIERGATSASLWVTEGNGAAERLYEGAGFTTEIERLPLRPGSRLMGRHLLRQLSDEP